MRLIGMIVGAALGIAVIAEGAYIVRTRSQLATLSERLEGLSSGADEGRHGGFIAASRSAGDPDNEGDEPVAEPRAARPLPRFVPTPAHPVAEPNNDDPLPLPAAITSPEAREQLRQFIVAQLERERQEARARDDQRREQRTQERREQLAKQLGLSPAETEKFSQLAIKADAARAALRDRIESGQVDRATIRQEMTTLRTDNDKEMRALLGDDRMQKFEQARLQQGGPDGPFGGRGFRGGGPGGGAAPNAGGRAPSP
jgi:ribosomal protein L19E